MGFKSPQSLALLAPYIVSIHVVDMEQRLPAKKRPPAKRRPPAETVKRLPILPEKDADERMDMQNGKKKKQPLEDMDETEDAQEEEEGLSLMEMAGDIFTISGRSYDIGLSLIHI